MELAAGDAIASGAGEQRGPSITGGMADWLSVLFGKAANEQPSQDERVRLTLLARMCKRNRK